MNISRQNGFLVISGMVRGVYLEKAYMYFTKREAISRFNKEKRKLLGAGPRGRMPKD